MEYKWQEKYVWYTVTDEGRLVHPAKGYRCGYYDEVLDDLFNSKDDAVIALHQFYAQNRHTSNHHILQNVYVKV